jgi:hypothetical protein
VGKISETQFVGGRFVSIVGKDLVTVGFEDSKSGIIFSSTKLEVMDLLVVKEEHFVVDWVDTDRKELLFGGKVGMIEMWMVSLLLGSVLVVDENESP